MAALIDYNAAKAFLKLSADTDQALIQTIIDATLADIDREFNGAFLTAAYTTEKYNGNGTERLWLKHRPVTAISALTVNEVAIQAAASPLGSGYLFDEFGIYLIGQHNQGSFTVYMFHEGIQNVSVSYTGGYAADSQAAKDMKLAALIQTAYVYKDRDRIGQLSISIGGQSTSFMTEAWHPRAKAILDLYRSPVPL